MIFGVSTGDAILIVAAFVAMMYLIFGAVAVAIFRRTLRRHRREIFGTDTWEEKWKHDGRRNDR